MGGMSSTAKAIIGGVIVFIVIAALLSWVTFVL
jgi:hypothetical protein